MLRPLLGLSLLLGLAVTGAVAQENPSISRERDRIFPDEIKAKAPEAKNAYDVIKHLRPHFLRARPSGHVMDQTVVPIKVYVNGGLIGGIESLREVSAESILLVEYLDGPSATTRYGTGNESGAILIRAGKGP